MDLEQYIRTTVDSAEGIAIILSFRSACRIECEG